MIKLQKTVSIHAPVAKVFGFLQDPHNLPEIWPSMIEVKDVSPSPAGGFNFGWVYKMGGLRFDGASETIEYVENQRIVTRSTKGIDSRFTWVYQRMGNDTKLTVDIEYSVPIPVLGKLAEAIIVKQNEHEAETLLKNLKVRIELEMPVAA
ncbi:MAG: SRPBCC family protein [Chloroflexota bacterium]